jgi:hypothetical protein
MGYRSCLGLVHLGGKYTLERLEAAAARAVFFGACSFTSVESILRHRLDKQPLPTTAEAPTTVLAHQNIRGAGYFDTIQ